MIKHTFLDLDGCPVDFLRGAFTVLDGRDLTLEERGIDLIINQNYSSTMLDTYFKSSITRAEFVKKVDDAGPEFWANLYSTPYSPLSVVEDFVTKTGCQLVILSNPSEFTYAVEGKNIWLKNHLKVPYSTVYTKEKQYLANTPNSILIDDTFSMCETFSKAGGRVFFYNAYTPHSLDNLTFLLEYEKNHSKQSST